MKCEKQNGLILNTYNPNLIEEGQRCKCTINHTLNAATVKAVGLVGPYALFTSTLL